MGYAVTDEGEAKKYYEMKKDYRLCVFWAAIWLSLSVPLPVSARQLDCQRQNPDVSQQTLSDRRVDEKQQIEALYKQMYRAMVEKEHGVSFNYIKPIMMVDNYLPVFDID